MENRDRYEKYAIAYNECNKELFKIMMDNYCVIVAARKARERCGGEIDPAIVEEELAVLRMK